MNRCRRHTGLLAGVVFALVPTIAVGQNAAGHTPLNVTLRGRVIDVLSKDPVHDAVVTLVGSGQTRRTHADGVFEFREVPAGVYSLRAVHPRYDDALQESVDVRDGVVRTVEIALSPRPVELEEVVVTPGAFSFMEGGGQGRQTMSREDIESVPQLGEDVFRAVNRLPGLASGDYSAHFSIRGGRHDETLIQFDGLELYEPYHLKDFNEGAISIIDTETIQGVELMTGGFPAQYGNKRSGVFNISSRVPDLDRTRYSVGISFLNARAMAMGPLAGGRGAWLTSARSGYMDLVFNIINQADLPSPRYHDVFAKMDWYLNSANTLSFNVLHAGDKYTFDAKSTTGFQDTLDTRESANNSYGNSYVWGTLSSELGDMTTVRTMVSAGLVTRKRDGTEFYTSNGEPLYELTNNRDFSIFGVEQDWVFRLSDRYVLSTGADVRRLKNTDSFTSLVGQDPNDPSEDPNAHFPVLTRTSTEASGTLLGLYLSARWRALQPLIFEVGGRYDHASYTSDSDVSPRVSAALQLRDGLTLRTAWGQYRQVQGIDDVAALNDDNRYYPSELSTQWTAGLEQLFVNGAVLRVDGYYKRGTGLRPVYRNYKGGLDVFPETNEDRLLVFPDNSTTKGVEVYYDQRFGPRVKTRASYAFAFADEEVSRIDNVNGPDPLEFDLAHPNPMDQRHALNVDCTYRLAQLWSLNGTFTFHTGWPTTLEQLIQVVDDDGEPDTAVRPTKIYGSRLPNYMRLDVRATRRWTTSHGDWRFFVELVNLTNHANVFGYDYFRTRGSGGEVLLQRDDEQWFTILPSLGVSWSSSF